MTKEETGPLTTIRIYYNISTKYEQEIECKKYLETDTRERIKRYTKVVSILMASFLSRKKPFRQREKTVYNIKFQLFEIFLNAIMA